jgi:UDP-2,4-diacetamido-2,4,6-trideoxy-beta-L-altropyranose hydrolase
MPRRVVIRAEVNGSVGMGHAMRCLWIAKALQERGADVVVVSERADPIETLAARHGVPRDFVPEGRGLDSAADADAMLAREADMIVIDSPRAQPDWADRIRASGTPLVAIAGVAGPQLQADGYLWPESCPEGNVSSGIPLVCGETYMPLAPAYWGGRRPIPAPHDERRILVTYGGVDHYDLSSMAISAIGAVFSKPCHIRVVIGAFYDNIENVRQAAAASRHQVELILQPAGIAEHIEWCDFAISAGGTALYEMAALGVPGIGVAVWPLQQPVVDRMSAVGLIQGLTYRHPEQMQEEFEIALGRIGSEPALLATQSDKGADYIDGRGAHRAAQWLETFYR